MKKYVVIRLLTLTAMSTSLFKTCSASDHRTPVRQDYPSHHNYPAYIELVTRYTNENKNDPTLKRLENEILITVEHLILTAPNNREKHIWINHKKTIEKRITHLKELQQELSHDRKKILHNKIILLGKLQNTYKQKDRGYQYFKHKAIVPLQELIQLEIASQDISPETIQEHLKQLVTCRLTDSMHEWLEAQKKVIVKRLSLEERLKEQRTTKSTIQPVIYYQKRNNLYQELLDTYQYPDIGKIPAKLKANVKCMQSKLTDLELACSFERLRAEDPNNHTKLMSPANTLARKFPKNTQYTVLAAQYTALFELDELAYQREMTDFTDDQKYNKLTGRINAIRPLIKDHAKEYAQLCSLEKTIKEEKESVDSLLQAIQQANLWDSDEVNKLCTSLSKEQERLPYPTRKTVATSLTLTKHYEGIRSTHAVITHVLIKELSKINTVHPFSKNDHEKYTELADAMEHFIDTYPLSWPTKHTTSIFITNLLKKQKDDFAKRTSIQYIKARKQILQTCPPLAILKIEIKKPLPAQDEEFDYEKSKMQSKPEVFQSVFMNTVCEDTTTVQFHGNQKAITHCIEQKLPE